MEFLKFGGGQAFEMEQDPFSLKGADDYAYDSLPDQPADANLSHNARAKKQRPAKDEKSTDGPKQLDLFNDE